MEIKIAFSGIGGVGGYYGGKLAAFYKGSDRVKIYFIARGGNLEMIREKGLCIDGPEGQIRAFPALATNDPAEIGIVDYLFCCTKSYDLDENIRELSPVIGPRTVVIPLLNGADISERIQQLLPAQEIWAGCVYIVARLAEPGVIRKLAPQDRLWFGNPMGSRERQHQLLQLLVDAGIEAQNPEDIYTRIWKKFFLISVSATLTSYYNAPIGQVLEFHRDDYERLAAELHAVAKAKGIILPEDMTERAFADQQKIPYEATTSMHSDFRNGKQTELESLTGYVVRAGQELHIPAPTYQKMYDELKQRR